MSLAQTVTRALGGDWHGTQGLAPMPGHTPKDRGLSIKDSDGGDDIILHSFSDDAFNQGGWRDFKDVLRHSAILPARAHAQAQSASTNTYEYADEAGAVLYRTKRIEMAGKAKRFLAEHLKGDRWLNGMGEVRRIPYLLPDIIAAPDATIYLVEGERKADKLASWGFVATSIAFGAKGWAEKHSYAEHFRGRTVVILPDNDEPGREYADKVRTSVNRVGKAIILDLPGLPPKGDIMDWAGNADELRALTASALAGPVLAKLPTINPATWQGLDTPVREWSLQDHMPLRQATLLTGKGGVGKSLLAQQIATCVALGLPVLGIETRKANALYISCEDDAEELWRRQAAICAGLNVRLSDLDGKLFLCALAGEDGNAIATYDEKGRLHATDRWRQIEAMALASDIGFAALDNASHLMLGDHNDLTQVAAFLNLLNGLAIKINGAALLLHHPNKAGDDWLGSVAWENQVRSRLIMKHDDINPDGRTLENPKANYARSGGVLGMIWYKGSFTREEDLPNNIGGELAASAAAAHDNALFLNCLDERNRQRRAVSESKASRTYAAKEFAGMAESKHIGRARLEAAMDRLFRISMIERGFLWRDGGEGKDISGLRRVSADGHKAPADLPVDHPIAPPADVPLTTRRPPIPHTLLLRSNGVPLGAAPHLEEQKPSTSRVCFPMTNAEAFEAEAWGDDA